MFLMHHQVKSSEVRSRRATPRPLWLWARQRVGRAVTCIIALGRRSVSHAAVRGYELLCESLLASAQRIVAEHHGGLAVADVGEYHCSDPWNATKHLGDDVWRWSGSMTRFSRRSCSTTSNLGYNRSSWWTRSHYREEKSLRLALL